MAINNPQSADRAYKFMYKMLDIRFHRYFYRKGDDIEFVETEISNTGQRKDVVAKIDGKTIQVTEFMATPVSRKKLKTISDYHISTLRDPQYKDFAVHTNVISIADANSGNNSVEIDDNLTFHVDTIFTKNRKGWKVLSTLVYKIIMREELSDEEAIDLLILPDMDIDMPINALMRMICFLIGHAVIPDADFKERIFYCEILILARFFEDDELSEMIEMLRLESENPEIQRVINKYGKGFESIYFDGTADGIIKGKIFVARNLLIDGFDEEVISRNTGFSIDKIREIKRKL